MKGGDGFHAYYSDLYGERWQELENALRDEGNGVALSIGGHSEYFLDPASLVCPVALEVQPGDRALDLCAAPGGKTLVLAAGLAGSGTLVANDRSADRRNRLVRVLDEHLPDRLRETVSVSGHDAARWALYHPNAYDRILADVPCSSERHVLHSSAALQKWSAHRPRRLAQQAYAIACAAADSLTQEGMLVYSTCALSTVENDRVIERLLDRADGALALCDPATALDRTNDALSSGFLSSGAVSASDASAIRITSGGPIELVGEQTTCGMLILPDRSGAGPIFYSVLRRTAYNSD